MRPQHESGRATWTRPISGSHLDGAPGTALHIRMSANHQAGDARYVRAFWGQIKAGVADLLTGACDAHAAPTHARA
jgi:hypothetical protein